jgi:ribosomal protein S18 acetylase RimI-like enzyme
MSVRELRADEIGAAGDTLALAFDRDPLFRFLLPEEETRAKWLQWLGRRTFGQTLAAGGAFAVEAGAGAGVIGLFPAGTWPPPMLTTIRSSGFLPAMPTYRWIVNGMRLEKLVKELHPPEPHLYISMVAVHPTMKGRGLGGALLRHGLALAKSAGMVAHLETSNPENLPLYRKFGFEVKHEVTGHGGPTVWVMSTHA